MIEHIIQEYAAKISARLDILLSENGQHYDEVVRAARYALLNPGKRIRPILLLEFYRACGKDDDCAYQFAAALEMIHCYSLIHDDLPCMDDDDFRRGKPACHKQFGEATALLAGDALLTEAFSVASKTVGIPSEAVVKAMGVLASYAGISGMVGGQMLDLQNENFEDIPISLLEETYLLKTGALLKAAASIGCILAGADEETVKLAEQYGEKVGLAFQIIDDILDHEGDEKTVGKPIGSDEKNHKKTLYDHYGSEQARKVAGHLTDEALLLLQNLPGDSSVLAELTNYLLLRKY